MLASELLLVLAWYLAALVVGLLALPAAFRLFARLPDRGYSLAKPFGLLVTAWIFWLLGSLGFLRNDLPGLLFAAALVGGLGLAWLGRPGLREMRAWLRQRRGYVFGVEAVFLLAFGLMAWVRAYNPEILHTEKPMEFMFINSVLASPTLPPQDAWLSGHAISYYHFGYIIIASLARLTATASEYAFNLGLALLFALTAVASLGVVANMAALALPAATDERQRLQRAFWPGLLAPLFVLVVGNFYGLVQMAYVNGLFAEARIPAVRWHFGAADPANAGLAPQSLPPNAAQPGVRAEMVNVWDWLDLKLAQRPVPPRPAQWRWDTGGNWFFAARVLHDRDLTGLEREAIDENPAFSFVLGDLHPHVLALPFVVLATALALDWLLWASGARAGERRSAGDGRRAKAAEQRPSDVRRATGDGPPADASQLPGIGMAASPSSATSAAADGAWLSAAELRRPGTAARLLMAGVVLGGLSFLNTWDFPIYLFLTLLAVALGLGLRLGWHGLVGELPRLAIFGVGLAVLSVILYLPFYLTFQSQAGGILPNLIWPTRFQQSFVFFGPVMVGIGLYAGWLAWRGRNMLDRRAALWAGPGLVLALVAAAALLGGLALASPATGALVDSHIAPLTRQHALGLALQRRLVDSLATLFPAALIALSAGMAVGVLRRVWVRLPAGEAQPAAQGQPAVAVAGGGPAGAPVAGRAAPERPWRHQRRVALPAGEVPVGSPAVLMALAMLATGALLMLGPEYVYLRDNFGTRMNTLFKFYFQTWTLWALVTAFGAWHIAQHARQAMRAAALVVVALAAIGGLAYTLPAVYARTAGFSRPPTLNGMAYFARAYPSDWAAIEWLRRNAAPTAVVAEASGGAYNVEEGRIAMATGRPNVIGWTNHQGQWRGQYYSRVADRPGLLSTLYQVRDWPSTQMVLDRYNIEYVIVGPTERMRYDTVYLPKFQQHMDLVLDAGNTLVFQRRPQLP
jgi:uncharacterized membrane protein